MSETDKSTITSDATPSLRKGKRRSKLKHDLRQLEVDAYCAVLSAFRAQGELTWKKESVLLELRHMLRISDEKHKMEMKRVREDENLFEISQVNCYPQFSEQDDKSNTSEESRTRSAKRQKIQAWAPEGNSDNHSSRLTAVPLPNANQPPNLTKLTPFKQPGGGSGSRKNNTKATKTKSPSSNKKADTTQSVSKETQNSGINEEGEETSVNTKPQSGSETALTKMDSTKDKVSIENIEASLKAEKERLRAELEQLEAELDDDDDDDDENDDDENDNDNDEENDDIDVDDDNTNDTTNDNTNDNTNDVEQQDNSGYDSGEGTAGDSMEAVNDSNDTFSSTPPPVAAAAAMDTAPTTQAPDSTSSTIEQPKA